MDAPNKKRRRSRRIRGAPATTVEARENQLISLAADLAEEQLANGTASSQVVVHFLKLGAVKAKLEMEKLKRENELLQAKTESLQSAKRIEALYAEALTAMRSYQGVEMFEGDEDDLDD